MEKLGEGTYGVVYKARDTETNEVREAEHLRVAALDCRAKEDQTWARWRGDSEYSDSGDRVALGAKASKYSTA